MKIEIDYITRVLHDGNKITRKRLKDSLRKLHSKYGALINNEKIEDMDVENYVAHVMNDIENVLKTEYNKVRPPKGDVLSEYYEELYMLSGYKYFLGNLNAARDSSIEMLGTMTDIKNSLNKIDKIDNSQGSESFEDQFRELKSHIGKIDEIVKNSASNSGEMNPGERFANDTKDDADAYPLSTKNAALLALGIGIIKEHKYMAWFLVISFCLSINTQNIEKLCRIIMKMICYLWNL